MREPKVTVAADDGVPLEIMSGETMRLEHDALVGLIEKSEGVEVARQMAAGTPKRGLPQVEADEPEVMIVEEAYEAPIEAAIEAAVVKVEAVTPVVPAKTSRFHDLVLGGAIAFCAMFAWYVATHL